VKSLLAEIEDFEPAFLPWRMSPDSIWLRADIAELRALAEYQSSKALALARQCLDSKEMLDASTADDA
jgi:hypothetical protein